MKYKLQITFSKCISNTLFNYFACPCQNTKYKIQFSNVIKIQNTFLFRISSLQCPIMTRNLHWPLTVVKFRKFCPIDGFVSQSVLFHQSWIIVQQEQMTESSCCTWEITVWRSEKKKKIVGKIQLEPKSYKMYFKYKLHQKM